MFYDLKYIKKSNKGLCGDDLKQKQQVDKINLNLISSVSEITKFHLPFSGDYVADYATVTMNNGDIYYIGLQSCAELNRVATEWHKPIDKTEHQFALDKLKDADRLIMEMQNKLKEMESAKQELIEGLEYFTKRVEVGSIRSKTTYNMYKNLIDKHKQI